MPIYPSVPFTLPHFYYPRWSCDLRCLQRLLYSLVHLFARTALDCFQVSARARIGTFPSFPPSLTLFSHLSHSTLCPGSPECGIRLTGTSSRITSRASFTFGSTVARQSIGSSLAEDYVSFGRVRAKLIGSGIESWTTDRT